MIGNFKIICHHTNTIAFRAHSTNRLWQLIVILKLLLLLLLIIIFFTTLTIRLKYQLQRKRLCIRIPVCEKSLRTSITKDRSIGNLERNGLVWIRSKEQQLPRRRGREQTLLKRRHESMSRLRAVLNLGILNLKQQRMTARLDIKLLRDTIRRPTDNNTTPLLLCSVGVGDCGCARVREKRVANISTTRLELCTTSQIGLMSLALRVRQIVAFVVMHCQAKRAVDLALVVATKVGVFRKVNGFKC
jgi:hypothetical protein